MTQIAGDAAKDWKVVRLDSFAEYADLVSADDTTGEVEYRDTPNTTKKVTVAAGIRLIPKVPRRSW